MGNVQTIELTSKKYKLLKLISWILLLPGLILAIRGNSKNMQTIGGLMFVVGVVLLVIVKIFIWWHHK